MIERFVFDKHERFYKLIRTYLISKLTTLFSKLTWWELRVESISFISEGLGTGTKFKIFSMHRVQCLQTKFYRVCVSNNWAMLSFVFTKHTYPTSDVSTCAESAIYILHCFVNNFTAKRDRLIFRRFQVNKLLPTCSQKLISVTFQVFKLYNNSHQNPSPIPIPNSKSISNPNLNPNPGPKPN